MDNKKYKVVAVSIKLHKKLKKYCTKNNLSMYEFIHKVMDSKLETIKKRNLLKKK